MSGQIGGAQPLAKRGFWRGDVLRLLDQLGADAAVAIEVTSPFVRVVDSLPAIAAPATDDNAQPPPDNGPPQAASAVLQAWMLAVVAHKHHAQHTPTEPSAHAASADEGAAVNPQWLTRLPRVELSSPARLAPFVRRVMRRPRPSQTLDLQETIAQLAELRPFSRFPAAQRLAWTADAALILDFSAHCLPLHADLQQLAHYLSRLSAFRTPVVKWDQSSWWVIKPGAAPATDPNGAEMSFTGHDASSSSLGPLIRSLHWAPIAQAELARLLSRARRWMLAGGLASPSQDDAAAHPLRAWVKRHQALGGELVLLSWDADALAGHQAFAATTRVVRWDYGQPLRDRRLGAAKPAARPDRQGQLQQLMLPLALLPRVSPDTLRAVRVALGHAVTAELDLWRSTQANTWGHYIQLGEQRPALLATLKQGLVEQGLAPERSHLLGRQQLLRIAQVLLRQQAGAAESLRARAVVALSALLGPVHDREINYHARRAGALFAQMRECMHTQAGTADADIAASFVDAVEDVVSALGGSTIAEFDQCVRYRLQQRQRNGALSESGFRPELLDELFASVSPRSLELVQQGNQLIVQPMLATSGASWVYGLQAARALRLTDERGVVQLYSASTGAQAVATLHAQTRIKLETSAETLDIAPLQRPPWASEWGRDRYGIYAEFQLQSVTQRLRWIPPGRFLMGLLAADAQRFDDEGPQHWVSLSEGFWLADTACSQALWRAVMGDEPSHFKGAELPVEQVSWQRVQAFLAALRNQLPGAEPMLPTEAQWEYACRAGTQTAFCFGEQIGTDQANYNGNFPYAGGAKGEYREKTVPVRSFAANRWGLYQMHGNVLEWCADAQRQYGGQDQLNPVGLGDAASLRVLRGGSWLYSANRLRSVSRHAFPPGRADSRIGFRLALRSGSTGQGAPGTGA